MNKAAKACYRRCPSRSQMRRNSYKFLYYPPWRKLRFVSEIFGDRPGPTKKNRREYLQPRAGARPRGSGSFSKRRADQLAPPAGCP
jgi:hypothetical protein